MAYTRRETKEAPVPRYVIWEVGDARLEHDRSALAPEQVADELAVMLTHPGYLDGVHRFSLGVRALSEDVPSLAEEPQDDLALENYMQCGGSAAAMSLEVRVSTPEGFRQTVLAREPVANDDAWLEIPYAHESEDRFITLHPEEVFTGEQAVKVFRDYILTGRVPPEDRHRLLFSGPPAGSGD